MRFPEKQLKWSWTKMWTCHFSLRFTVFSLRSWNMVIHWRTSCPGQHTWDMLSWKAILFMFVMVVTSCWFRRNQFHCVLIKFQCFLFIRWKLHNSPEDYRRNAHPSFSSSTQQHLQYLQRNNTFNVAASLTFSTDQHLLRNNIFPPTPFKGL